MTKRHKVLLYTIDDVSDYARECARSLDAQEQLELVSRTHEVFSSPTAEELDGVEAVLGEFMPVRGAEVDVMADAGVRLVASMSIGINHVDVAGLAAAWPSPTARATAPRTWRFTRWRSCWTSCAMSPCQTATSWQATGTPGLGERCAGP